MSMETSVILRALLYQAMKTDDVNEIRDVIKVMCTKDDIAAVKEQIAEMEKRAEKK